MDTSPRDSTPATDHAKASPPPAGGLRHAAARGVFWISLGNWGTQLGTVLVFLVLARLLEPADFGLVALAAVFLDVVDTLVEQGFGHAIVQRRDLEAGHLDSAFAISGVIAALFVTVTLVTAPHIAVLLRAPDLTNILRVMSLTFILVAFSSVQQAQLQRELRFKALAARSSVALVVGGTAGIGAALAGMGAWSLVLYQLVRESTAVIVLWSASRWRPGLRGSWRHAGDLWAFSVNVAGVRLFVLGARRIADLLIGRGLGTIALGFYSVGDRLVVAINRMLTNSLYGIVLPTFSRLEGDVARVREALYQATRFTALVSVPAFVSAAVLAPDIVPLWFGARWAPSIPVMQALALLGLTQAFGIVNGGVLQAVGRPRAFFLLSALAAVTTLLAVLIALPYGITGVAIALLLRTFVTAPVGALVLRRHLGWHAGTYLRHLAAPFGAGLVLALTGVGARAAFAPWLSPAPRLLATIPLMLAVYGLTIRVAAPGTYAAAIELAKVAVPRLRRRAGAAQG